MESSSSLLLSSRSDIQPVDPSQVPEFVREDDVEQYFQVAIVTVLVYDALITLDKEVKYFWKIPRKPVDVVYFANRYIGILGASAFIVGAGALFAWTLLSNFAIWTRDIANWTTVILIDYILVIRVLALHSQSRRLSVCLHSLLALEAAFKMAIVIYVIVLQHVVVVGLAKDATACDVSALLSWHWGLVDWTIPLVFGIILMALAVYKAAEYWKLSAGFKGFTLVKVLIEDQVLYFSAVAFCSVMEILSFKLEIPNLFLSGVLDALGNPAFLCILGSRMLFNLKEAGERGQNEGTSYNAMSRTVSDMDFVQARPANPGEHELSEVVHAGEQAGAV